MQQRYFIADLIACSTCFRHKYAHHHELKSIIQWLLPVVFRAVVLKLLVWCGAEGYVSGLQDAGLLANPFLETQAPPRSKHIAIHLLMFVDVRLQRHTRRLCIELYQTHKHGVHKRHRYC